MRLLSWNLLHGSGADADDVARLVETYNPDVVLMQEAGPRLDTLQARLGGHYARRQMRNRKHGLAAWSQHKLEELEPSLSHGEQGWIFPFRFSEQSPIASLC